MVATLASGACVTPEQHFRHYFYAAVDRLLTGIEELLGSREEALRQFPFLEDYLDSLARHDIASPAAAHLPLRALQDAASLTDDALSLLMAVGLNEEDVRFGPLFEALQCTPGQH